jgi:hypothetical protein
MGLLPCSHGIELESGPPTACGMKAPAVTCKGTSRANERAPQAAGIPHGRVATTRGSGLRV